LLTTGSSPAWSPDGTRIAFVRDGRIFAINIDGSGEIPLSSPGLEQEDNNPKWSPDGSKLAFVRGDQEDLDGYRNSNLWVMNSDGSNAVELTHFFQRGTNGLIYGHAWSPDGGRLAFAGYTSGGQDILLVNPDGSGLVNLTSAYMWLESDPSWSPDGSRILFSAEPRDPETLEAGPAEIFVIGSDGRNLTNLSNNPAIDVHAVWQP
jgi:Tol biopolymer transport system component